MKNKVSPEVEAQAAKIAKSRQKEGQTKEQTKLIAKGIQQGIAEYKKQQNKKLRELDKQRKQKSKSIEHVAPDIDVDVSTENQTKRLPWILLAISWVGFLSYLGFLHLS